MSTNRHPQLLQEATEAARSGDNGKARRLLDELLNEDDSNVRAWMLLYRVSDNADDKRRALHRVVELDPTNVRAKEALERLEGTTLRSSAGSYNDGEVAPGIPRQTLTLIVGGLFLLVIIVLGGAFAVLTANNQRQEQEFQGQTAFALASTDLAATETRVAQENEAQTAFVVASTELAATETQIALGPTLTNTREGPPTLPPTFTATAQQVTAAAAQLPTPGQEIGGFIMAFGGDNLLNDGYYPVVSIAANNGTLITTLSGEERGRYPHGISTSRIVYSQYSRDTFEQSLVAINAADGSAQILPELWRNSVFNTGSSLILNADQPNVSADGSRVVFAADVVEDQRHLFILDFNDTDGDPLTRLTSDNADYSFPAFSPTGQLVIAARTDATGQTDLFEITPADAQIRPMTQDGSLTVETMPRYSPDSLNIVFAANTGGADPHDIFERDSSGNITNISDNPADDLHPVYSPDGRYIAYASNRDGGYNIYIYERGTGTLYQLTTGRNDYFPGTWLSN
jgi:hypothetical protein